MPKCEACGEGAAPTETKVHPMLGVRNARLYGREWVAWMCDDCGHWNLEYEEEHNHD